MAFSREMISDQKRLCRGEHWLAARTLLRVRDQKHHAKWRVLMLAGEAPEGELTAIRELMPKAYVMAVDRDQACLSAAIDAGADDVMLCDLFDYSTETTTSAWGSTIVSTRPYQGLWTLPTFDVVCLDLCSVASPEVRELIAVYGALVAKKGAYIVTFAMGRDVSEVYAHRLTQARRRLGTDTRREMMKSLTDQGCNDEVLGRLNYLFPQFSRIRSVIAYKGHEMPMCSVLLGTLRSVDAPVSFVRLAPGDFELAVTQPEAMRLYDCPQERIDALRRKHAAIKAAYTKSKPQLSLLSATGASLVAQAHE